MQTRDVFWQGAAALLLFALAMARPSLASAHGLPDEPPQGLSPHGGYPTVSLTFDDSHAMHRWAAEVLSRRGMVGTFYVNSPRIGNEGYLREEDLRAMEALGHEIGGHTLHHPALGRLEEAAQIREICNDRAALLSMGLSIRSFAYPFNSYTPATLFAAERCGYVSARGAAGIATPQSCRGCPLVESIPPRETFRIRSFPSYQGWMGVETLKEAIEAPQSEDGWLIFVFHDFCHGEDCASPYSMPGGDFLEFIQWLKGRGIRTRTVSEMVPGDLHPAVYGPPTKLPLRIGTNLLRNPGLLGDGDANGMPDCWMEGGYGDREGSLEHIRKDGVSFTRLSVSEWESGDHKFLSARGACAPSVRGGQRFRAAVRHRTQGHARMVAFYQDASGHWQWWANSPPLVQGDTWKWSEWDTPSLPPDAAAIQIGLSLRSVGWVEAQYFSLELLDPDHLPPSCSAAPLGLLLAGLAASGLARSMRAKPGGQAVAQRVEVGRGSDEHR